MAIRDDDAACPICGFHLSFTPCRRTSASYGSCPSCGVARRWTLSAEGRIGQTRLRFEGEALCPVCGHRLDFVPWLATAASHRTCPSCGTRFGFHDMLSGGDPQLLAVEHERLRGRWLEHGATWHSETTPAPPRWDPERQLLDLQGR